MFSAKHPEQNFSQKKKKICLSAAVASWKKSRKFNESIDFKTPKPHFGQLFV